MFPPIKGKVLRAEALPRVGLEENTEPLASDARCGLASDEQRLAPGTAVIQVAELPPEWLSFGPNTLLDSDYKSEHEIIR